MQRLAAINWTGVRRDGHNIFTKLIRTKDPHDGEPEGRPGGRPRLARCLTTLDLTSLGVGSCVGTGMYLVSGMVARKFAGPGVILSFIIAAIASIFSGACYAEFGVRVPHTTGSAYMYSYVSVGEFVAFVIGWNMILEYLIGTSACARALSACFDSLIAHQISNYMNAHVGTVFGKPPDILAFSITLVMMLILIAGVKKSLALNNTLNAINLVAWVFMLGAGLFYVDTDNWVDVGFLPFGWSGVFSGAATCFYAFIGFDIIATTGEEANNPQRSIPLSIVLSLGIILGAYVTSSVLLTLIVPFDKIDMDSALVKMFDHVNAPTCKYVVAIGALAGLTVSMFGSMFPMPRVVYAMARDGLIFRCLAQVRESTGTPALATLVGGVMAAILALFVQLEILVEMMSIGTLLAYTLVSTCVLILRYQPNSTNLIELLPQSIRTPIPDGASGQQETAFGAGHTHITGANQRVMVRRVTRSSPDSDDSIHDESDEYGRDDAFLVTDRTESKFYVPGPATVHCTKGLWARFWDAIGYRFQAVSYLCPGLFPWVEPGVATDASGLFVTKTVGVIYVLILSMDLLGAYGNPGDNTFTNYAMFCLFVAIILSVLVISRKPQNRINLMYATPGLPLVPVIAITFNIYLILNLSYLTLVRFIVWMALGMIVYFQYGIKNSNLENPPQLDEEASIEVTVVPRPAINLHRNIFEGDRPHVNFAFYGNDEYADPLNAWDREEKNAAKPAHVTVTLEERYDERSNTTRAVAAGRPPWANADFPTWDD